MLVRVYRTDPCTSSILRAALVAEVEIDNVPEDVGRFADDYGGDFIEIEPFDPEEEEYGSIRHD